MDAAQILLVGGTDGGNARVLLHNAERLAKARLSAPVVVDHCIHAAWAGAQRYLLACDGQNPRTVDIISENAAVPPKRRPAELVRVIGLVIGKWSRM